MKKTNYLNNKDILAEIHKSKNTYCSYTDPEYHRYDIILPDLSFIFNDDTKIEYPNTLTLTNVDRKVLQEAKENKAKRLSTEKYDLLKSQGIKVKQAECEYPIETITDEEIIFRVSTFDHIPDEPGRKKNPKTIADTKTKLNFPPFKHYKFNDNGELECVGKSHWKGDVEHGKFSKSHGQATNKLAKMWIKLCERYGTRGNVRGYTYNDEMQGQAILQLAQIGLQFDESKSNNPFAYYTAAVTNSFVRVINIEKRNQSIRDDLLEINDMDPSYTRQTQGQWERELKRENENAD